MNTSKLDITVRVVPLGILMDKVEQLRSAIAEQVQELQDELDRARAENAELRAKYTSLAQMATDSTPSAIEQQLQALVGTEVTVEYWSADRDTNGGSIETVSGLLTRSEYGWHVAGKPFSSLTTFGHEDVVTVEGTEVKPTRSTPRLLRENTGGVPQYAIKYFYLSQDDCRAIEALIAERQVCWPSLVRQALEADGFTFPAGVPLDTYVCQVSLPSDTAIQIYDRSRANGNTLADIFRCALSRLGLNLRFPVRGRPKGSATRIKR